MSRLERRLLVSVLMLFAVPAAVGTVLLVVAYRAGAFDGDGSALLTVILAGLLVVLVYAPSPPTGSAAPSCGPSRTSVTAPSS